MVSHSHVFGCVAYVHVSKAKRHKLDSKTRKCVLLGYGTNQKGYCLYDLECMKVIHNRDVVFDETSMPGIQKEATVKYVEFEIDEESNVEHVTPRTSDSAPDMTTADEQLDEEHLPTSSSSEVALRRSTRSKQQPDWYGHCVMVASTEQTDPSSVSKVKSAPDKLKWENAMETEMKSLSLKKFGSW